LFFHPSADIPVPQAFQGWLDSSRQHPRWKNGQEHGASRRIRVNVKGDIDPFIFGSLQRFQSDFHFGPISSSGSLEMGDVNGNFPFLGKGNHLVDGFEQEVSHAADMDDQQSPVPSGQTAEPG
jgi:hypothetical protein